MTQHIDDLLETRSSNALPPAEFSSPKLTLGVLRFVAGAALIIGLLVGFFTFLFMAMGPSRSVDTTWMIALGVGSLAQGFIIYALFNAIALIIENLVGIRAKLSNINKVENIEASTDETFQEK